MEKCKRLWNQLTSYGRKQVHIGESSSDLSSQIVKYVDPFESHMMTLQSLLIWENPKKSVFMLIIYTLCYWVLYVWPVGIVTAISTCALILFVHYEWVTKIWPEIRVEPTPEMENWIPVHPNMMTPREISRYIEQGWNWISNGSKKLINLRKHKPGQFCITMVSFFAVTLVIGMYVSGVILGYIVTMGLLLLPLIMQKSHYLPDIATTWWQKFWKPRRVSRREHPDNDLAEFLPEERCEETQEALQIPFNSSQMVEEVSKFNIGSLCGNFFSPDTSGFPSFTSDMQTELPSITTESAMDDLTPEKPDIEFTSAHFGDSSDDDSFTEGLQFPVKVVQVPEESSDDSLDGDFEIIDINMDKN